MLRSGGNIIAAGVATKVGNASQAVPTTSISLLPVQNTAGEGLGDLVRY